MRCAGPMADHGWNRWGASASPRRGRARPAPDRVLVDGLTPVDEQGVRDLAVLLGLEVVAPTGAEADVTGVLVLVGDRGDGPEWVRRGARVVRIGQEGTMRLPEDREALAQVLATPAGRGSTGGGPGALVLGVAGAHGGAGATSLAVGLALRRACVLVDAQGPGPGVWAGPWRVDGGDHAGIRWSDLATGESLHTVDLVDHLPVCEGVAVLGPDARGWAHAGDPRMPGVLGALRRAGDVVVDLGRWDGRWPARTSPGGPLDVLCLVGAGDERSAQRLAAGIAAHPPDLPVLPVHTDRSASFAWRECARALGSSTTASVRVRPGRGPGRGGGVGRDLDRVWDAARAVSLSTWITGLGVGAWTGEH